MHMACSHRVLTERSHTACSHGMLTHSVRTPERPASPRLAVAPTHSLLLAPQARHGFPTRSSRFPRCRGRKGAGLPPAPQLRVPRSTAGSEVSSVSARQADRDALGVPSSPRTRSAAHSWRTQHRPPRRLPPPHQVTLDAACTAHNPQRLLLGRRRVETVDAEVDDVGSTKPSMAPAVSRPRRFVSLTRAYILQGCEPSCACGPEAGCRGYSAPTSPVLHCYLLRTIRSRSILK